MLQDTTNLVFIALSGQKIALNTSAPFFNT